MLEIKIQDPGSSVSYDKTSFENQRSAGSHNKRNFQGHKSHEIPQENLNSDDPQDLTAKLIKHQR